MPVIVVANPKGGAGKSTLATNVAGYLAAQGHAVMLGDADRQQSSRLWLGLRPAVARRITSWDVTPDMTARPPKGHQPCGARHARRSARQAFQGNGSRR
jgi:chromosome partitioning protein